MPLRHLVAILGIFAVLKLIFSYSVKVDLGFEDENDFVSPAKVRRLALKHFFNLAEDHKKLQRLKNIGFDGTKSIVRLAQNQFKPSTDKITVTCQELKIYVDHFLAPNKRGLTTARYLYEVRFHDFFHHLGHIPNL